MIRAKIDERLERRFRELAMKRFGYGKGALSKAVEEAILNRISLVEKEEVSFEGDPVEAIDGLLSDININSVQLQHIIKKIWVNRMTKNVSD
ncbi:MAG: hypothetical protein ACTSYM_06720 [Candidatus Baldrarchaeia archaeon]